jgi:hypothetical protein
MRHLQDLVTSLQENLEGRCDVLRKLAKPKIPPEDQLFWDNLPDDDFLDVSQMIFMGEWKALAFSKTMSPGTRLAVLKRFFAVTLCQMNCGPEGSLIKHNGTHKYCSESLDYINQLWDTIEKPYTDLVVKLDSIEQKLDRLLTQVEFAPGSDTVESIGKDWKEKVEIQCPGATAGPETKKRKLDTDSEPNLSKIK